MKTGSARCQHFNYCFPLEVSEYLYPDYAVDSIVFLVSSDDI